MLPNKKIFCNTPWYELHIYWDGSFGICCQESHKLHSDSEKYNIKTLSIMDWFNSDPVKTFRTKMLGNTPASECKSCYLEEEHNGVSRRLRSNQKSVIFTKTAFDPSFLQSPGYQHFEYSNSTNGQTKTHPIDIHVDLGNFCNLACKMCNAMASSTIASQHVKWNIAEDKKYLGQDWTKDQATWNSFKTQLLNMPGLNNIHVMGGETLLTDRFEDLVDTMIAHKRFELCFSFVTNGTVFKPELIDKLKKFRRVGFEVSIETLDDRNSYIRQGTDTELVLKNINQYISQCNNSSVTLSLRPAPSLLSVGSYPELLSFALANKLIVKSNLCYKPEFLNIAALPTDVKKLYLSRYETFLNSLSADAVSNNDYNASDSSNYLEIIKDQARMCMSLLATDAPADIDTRLKQLVDHCKRWDNVYKFNARELYPELQQVWDQYGY